MWQKSLFIKAFFVWQALRIWCKPNYSEGEGEIVISIPCPSAGEQISNHA